MMFSSFSIKSLVLCLSLFGIISCSGEGDGTIIDAFTTSTDSAELVVVSNTDTSDAASAPNSTNVSLKVPGVITLNWTPPTENTDNSTLLDLSGYKIYYGEAENELNNTITVSNSSLSTYVIENLQPGNVYYVAITSYNSNGTESIMSNINTVTL